MIDLDVKQIKILICGSRDWVHADPINSVLDNAFKLYRRPIIVMEGGAKGADEIARNWSNTMLDKGLHEDQLEHQTFYAEWSKFGKEAGPRRNLEMLSEKPSIVYAFKNKLISKGTDHMVNIAQRAGIPTVITFLP